MIKPFYFKQFNLAFFFVLSINISSIWTIYWTLSGATTPGQSWPGSDSNEGVQRITQSSIINEASPSDCLVLYPWHPLCWGFYPSRDSLGVFYIPSLLKLNWLIYLLIFKAYQPYLSPRDKIILFIIISYIHFCVVFFSHNPIEYK